jgi:hypothetical protein
VDSWDVARRNKAGLGLVVSTMLPSTGLTSENPRNPDTFSKLCFVPVYSSQLEILEDRIFERV